MAKMPDGYVFIPRVTEIKTDDKSVIVNAEVEEKELVMCRSCRYGHPLDHEWYKCHKNTLFKLNKGTFYCADGELRKITKQGGNHNV